MRLSRVWPIALMLVPVAALALLLWVNPMPPAARTALAISTAERPTCGTARSTPKAK